MDHFPFYLQMPLRHQQPGAQYLLAVFFEQTPPNDQVIGTGLVFQRDKTDTAGSPRALANKNEPRNFYELTIAKITVLAGGADTQGPEVLPYKADRMPFQG